MPLRADIVRRKLLSIEEATGRLRSWMPISLEKLKVDLKLQWAVERGLQVAAESLFDAGNHILSGAFQETVDEYREIPARLAAHGVVTPQTEARLQSLSGFRNILVHEYAAVDLVKLQASLSRLDDFDAFVGDVVRWLDAREDSG
jgi:uncharacterized protein YutE (UPF0331/DUF86 family)